jgi:hypothetical protein
MLSADAHMLTGEEEIKSHNIFARLNSRKTITGDDESGESEFKYLQEIRKIRDTQPEIFTEIKKLPNKAHSTRYIHRAQTPNVESFPALLTYFRKKALDKFYLTYSGNLQAIELDFFTTAKILKPEDLSEKLHSIPNNFYELLAVNKSAFRAATNPVREEEAPSRQGSSNEAYILYRLKVSEIRKYHGFTEDNKAFLDEVIEALVEGRVTKHSAKLTAEALKREKNPLLVPGILRRHMAYDSIRVQRQRQGVSIVSRLPAAFSLIPFASACP